MFDSYFNACWFTVITLTTIGYGDMSPVSPPGRFLTMILAFWGALLLSLVVVIVSSIFNLGDDEKMALRHLRLTKEAAKTITSGLQYFIAKKKLHVLKAPKCHNINKCLKDKDNEPKGALLIPKKDRHNSILNDYVNYSSDSDNKG